jgi:hypothetical protein
MSQEAVDFVHAGFEPFRSGGLQRHYFAISTLTTSSIADPDLTLTSEAIKIFTAFYVLTGIGILVAGTPTRRRLHKDARGAARHAARPSAPQGRSDADAVAGIAARHNNMRVLR